MAWRRVSPFVSRDVDPWLFGVASPFAASLKRRAASYTVDSTELCRPIEVIAFN